MAAKGALFTRMLAHHAEVGLTAEQIAGLLTLSGEYHDKQVALRVEFMELAERAEIKWGRVDADFIASREQFLRRRSELLFAEESLFFEYARRGHDLLSDEQIAAAEIVYHTEKDAWVSAMSGPLGRALAPSYAVERSLTDATSSPTT
ncbi:hypothetical protein [Nocardia carnea]|uniref:hypothetical protein n=1 Tax=Nocardia carnea TaxID=37328 RepID=UPI00245806B0|nr:hypothetical protein [Nocardia carnea]